MLSVYTNEFTWNKEKILKMTNNNLLNNYFAINKWMQNIFRKTTLRGWKRTIGLTESTH